MKNNKRRRISMSSKYFATLTALILSLMIFMPAKSNSQVIEATGNSQESASQLIYYYNLAQQDTIGSENDENHIQVTNVNDTTGTWIHVKVFRTYDPNLGDPTSTVICDERNFVDFLTPNDTHVYELDDNTTKNQGEAEGVPGEAVNIDFTDPVPTEGFVVITPVVSEADLSAISFHYLIGSSNHIGNFSFNAMGRSAVDFATGEKVEDGTPLDGTTNGFVLLQPEELIFSFTANDAVDEPAEADIVGLTFTDVYGEPGLLGYQVTQGSSTWNPFIFDWKESVTSCGQREIACYSSFGLNDDVQHLTDENFGDADDGVLLCGGASTPEHPVGSLSDYSIGWTRIFVSGLDDFENQLGVYVFEGPAYDAKWMNSNR